MLKNFLYLVLIFFTISMHADHAGIIIIVHGTWGTDSTWCKPGGAFFDELEKSAETLNKKVVSYMWPGYLHHESRLLAAHGLVKLIQSYPRNMHLTIVAHSHGGNVAILASQLMHDQPNNKHCIDVLYTMGTPINVLYYQPNMHIIKRLYNLFSFADKVQLVLGIFGRVFPEHPHIANIRLMLDGQEPGHVEMCTALSGKWLPHIHEELARKNIGYFQDFNFNKPAIITLHSQCFPLYSIDTQRSALLEKDHLVNEALYNAFRHGATEQA